jgi:hypothetical protein
METNDTLTGLNVHVEIGDFDFYIHVVDNADGSLNELRITSTRKDSDMKTLITAVYELINLCVAHRVPIIAIVQRLEYMQGDTGGVTNNPDIRIVSSVIDFVAKFLKRRYCGGDNGDTSQSQTIPFAALHGGEANAT